jgi:hypothetical protein
MRDQRRTLLPGLVLLYAVASLLHFAHNAEYLEHYPNLPDGLTRWDVYAVWLGIAAIGAAGYASYRRAPALGLALLGIYAAIGFDSLLHYGRAPFAAHTLMMNFTIVFEVGTASLLLAAVVVLAARRLQRG